MMAVRVIHISLVHPHHDHEIELLSVPGEIIDSWHERRCFKGIKCGCSVHPPALGSPLPLC